MSSAVADRPRTAPARRLAPAPGHPSAPTGSRTGAPIESDAGSAQPRPAGPAEGERRRDPLRLAFRLSPLLGLGLSIALVWWGLDTGVLSSLARLQTFVDSLGAWGPLAFCLASTASVVFPIVPAGLLVLAGPVLFGPVEGTIYNYVSVCAGSMLNFAIARHVGLSLIERLFTPKLVDKYLGWTRTGHFTRAFAIAIALPVAPDDLLCYLAGTTRMTWRTYATIILTCKPWAIIAYGLGISSALLSLVPW